MDKSDFLLRVHSCIMSAAKEDIIVQMTIDIAFQGDKKVHF